jgi:hypothetical protein
VVGYVQLHWRAQTLAKRWGSAFGSLAKGRPNREPERPPRQDSRLLFALLLRMDTIFVDEALLAYRNNTGDLRSWESLPVAVISQLLREAQHFKIFRNEGLLQPTATDGDLNS